MALDYKSWVRAAQDRLDELKETRKEIQEEISKLEAGIKAFSPLIGENVPLGNEMGLTEAIRQIFIESNRSPLAPTGIRDELRRRGFLLEQKNPLAAIHQILARLVERDFAEKVAFQGGTYYRWKGMIMISDLMNTNFSERLASQFDSQAFASYQEALKEIQVRLVEVSEHSAKKMGELKGMTGISDLMSEIGGKPISDHGKKK